MKKLICEAGATKTDWRVIENGQQLARHLGAGLNVSTMDMAVIRKSIREAADALTGENEKSGAGNLTSDEPFGAIHFYAAGVVTPHIHEVLTSSFRSCFGTSGIEIQTDLMACARAACFHAPGVAAILGTGSNSCQFDGEKIVRHVKSGGFILGDEGSASVLGKWFVSDYIKGLVPAEIAAEYASQFPSEYADIVEQVYHNPGSPSAWLGSLCPFLLSHYGHPYIRRMVDGNFQAFIDRSLRQYDIDQYPVGIVGGFGYACQGILRPLFEAAGIRIRAFIPAPIEELIKYHA
ncbi:MAG: hypothetical protein J6X69_00290 [Bacteroidales bacterium]|nr:hypothetical protein [Bacteroidales bacterium]